MKSYLCTAIAGLAIIAAACSGNEGEMVSSEVSVNGPEGTIYGILHRPKGKKNTPLVIVSHGFGGSHVYGKTYADALVPEGYAVYCYDFCGGSINSLSDGKTTDMSIFSEKEDLLAVMDGLEADGIDTSHVILIGESQGGMVSALAAAERPERVGKLILVYPALCIRDDWVKMFPNAEDMPEEIDFWGIKLSRNYRRGLDELDVYGTIGLYNGPVLIFHGDNDAVVPLSYSVEAEKTYRNARLVVLPGEGHGFTPEAQEKVNGEIGKFLKAGRQGFGKTADIE